MSATLEERLLGFLAREEHDEVRSERELRALPIEARVLEGECIHDAVLAEQRGDLLVLTVEENLSKFRPGDAVVVSDGHDLSAGAGFLYRSYDAHSRQLELQRDRFARGDLELESGARCCIDRRSLALRGRLRDVVRAAFVRPDIAAVLAGAPLPPADPGREERARTKLEDRGLDPSQIDAGAAAIASARLTLIQGPPGTGKTRMLAEMLALLCGAGCRIALTAFTHRAVNHVLRTLNALAPSIPLIKLGRPGSRDGDLRETSIRFADPRDSQRLPPRGVLVAGTCFQLAKLPPRPTFHYTVFDEAAQLPIPHALAGMLLAERWILLGDHQQLSPVVTARHADTAVTTSIFEHLHAHYGAHLLSLTYRMNAPLCEVIGGTFYGGRLHAAPGAAARRMPFYAGGRHDEVLDPDRPAVLARVDHLQPGTRSTEEAALIADLGADLLRHHRIPPAEIAIVTPFRTQARTIRSALERVVPELASALVVDTVERIQGQEREVVLISLAVGDPDTLHARAGFFFSTKRLNVAMSRARTKCVLVASRGAFEGLPRDPASLAAASAFRRLFATLPQVDLTRVYGG